MCPTFISTPSSSRPEIFDERPTEPFRTARRTVSRTPATWLAPPARADRRGAGNRFGETHPGPAFAPFEFQGYVGNRRVVSFGWPYDFARQVLETAEPMPDFLLSLRQTVAAFTGHDPEAFRQAWCWNTRRGQALGAATVRNWTRSSGFP
jgi:hypothetical protein